MHNNIPNFSQSVTYDFCFVSLSLALPPRDGSQICAFIATIAFAASTLILSGTNRSTLATVNWFMFGRSHHGNNKLRSCNRWTVAEFTCTISIFICWYMLGVRIYLVLGRLTWHVEERENAYIIQIYSHEHRARSIIITHTAAAIGCRFWSIDFSDDFLACIYVWV